MSYFMNYFRKNSAINGSPPPAADKMAMRALPSNWYSSNEMYELERRAIFSRKWQLITHKNRFHKAGDWLRYEVAGYNFVLCRDRQDNINGFHNVCRHRAFPIVLDDQGCNKIFSCKYHGWSYALNGKLSKAPGYQELEGFDKSKNNLFPIHVHVDHNGFIWVNFDAKEVPEVAWEDNFDGIDKMEKYSIYNFDDYEFDHTWQMDGPYNWKILADNYNECYHCATAHPDIGALANLQSYSVITENGNVIHNPATTEAQRQAGLTVAATYFFPNVSTNVTPHFFMVQRFVPISPSQSIMRYEVFRNKHSTDAEFDLVNQIYKRIMSEDKYLCDAAQKNVNAGVFTNGEMHPRLEKGPLHFQATVRECVMAHHAKEQAARHIIEPARHKLPEQVNSLASKKDIDFCVGLSCPATANQEGLVW